MIFFKSHAELAENAEIVFRRISSQANRSRGIESARSDCFSNQNQMWKNNVEDKFCEFSEICERKILWKEPYYI